MIPDTEPAPHLTEGTRREICNKLLKIDPLRRLRWIDASLILRGIGLELEAIWVRWSAPLNLPINTIALWRASPGTHSPDPLAALEAIARRRGAR